MEGGPNMILDSAVVEKPVQCGSIWHAPKVIRTPISHSWCQIADGEEDDDQFRLETHESGS